MRNPSIRAPELDQQARVRRRDERPLRLTKFRRGTGLA